ncbi:MAG: hydroxyacid dehydrogenase [Methylacidiphilales bacterium]|nr:hydroxyacid dehydrogenase [Candidatus Methylacidiphilales bacterium]
MPNFESQLMRDEELPPSPKEKFWTKERRSKVAVTALYLLKEEAFDLIYGSEERASISSRVKILDHLITPQSYEASSEIWPEVEMIFSGWGMVPMDETFFRRFPKLKVVFYGAGTVRSFVTDAFWKSKIRLTNAALANAVPVSEFTLSQILLALKHAWQKAFFIRKHKKFPPLSLPPGTYHTTVGLISLGIIGRLVAERLQHFDLNVVAYDPLFPPQEAEKLNVKLLSLEKVFRVSNVVSCHAPVLKETERMIRRRHFESMKPGATFINTARGAVVDEGEMIHVLKERPDLFAILDVSEPMPPDEGSPLYALENVMLTPQIAGSLGSECRRMGKLMIEELDRFLSGKPLRYEIDEERFQSMA